MNLIFVYGMDFKKRKKKKIRNQTPSDTYTHKYIAVSLEDREKPENERK